MDRYKIILLSGGKAVRAGLETPKQYCDIAGRPMVQRAMDIFRFLGCEYVIPCDPVYRWTPKDGQVTFVEPGETRSLSVHSALHHLREVGYEGTVIIHEAGRPYLEHEDIVAYLAFIDRTGSKNSSTVGRVVDGLIHRATGAYLEKAAHALGMAPQACDFDLLLEAHEMARTQGDDNRGDDCGLLQHYLGVSVDLFDISYYPKVTFAKDIAFYRALFRYLEGAEETTDGHA